MLPDYPVSCLFVVKTQLQIQLEKQNSSYKQIVKSTGIFGGVQVVSILIGLVRNKVLAVWLGPLGFGLISLYQTIIDLIKSTTIMGLDTAGVRDIAENADNVDLQYRKISVLRFWIGSVAILGSLICIVFCYPISVFVFEDGSYALQIALLSVCLLFTILSTGQAVILQGTRNLVYMAKFNVLGNITGLIVSLILYYFYGVKAIIPAFITGSIILFFFSSFYVRKLRIPRIKIERSVAFHQGLSTLKLGFFIVSVSIMEHLSMLLIKSFLTRQAGIEAVGIVQPAWTISVSYIGLILKSMGTDFFPRLCTISNRPLRMRQLVNEQTYIALLAALPIMVIMMVFSRLVLPLLFSVEFLDGVSVLQWYIAGTFFKVLSWPLAFVLLARGKGLHFLLTEIVYFGVYLSASYFLYPLWGINSIGIAYLLSYIAYLVVLYIYTSNTLKFRWSRQNILFTGFCLALLLISGLSTIYFKNYWWVSAILISLISVSVSLYLFNNIFSLQELFKNIRRRFLNKK